MHRSTGRIVIFLQAMCMSTLVAVGGTGTPEDGAGDACGEARRRNAWCEAGNVGFVAGVEITSRILHEALDTHGHDLNPATLGCSLCAEAARDSGYCATHRLGFADGQAYLSRLTYLLARGSYRDPATVTCPTCRDGAESHGWCDEHGRGMVGPFTVTDREEFNALVEEVEKLRLLMQAAGRCEQCAAAMLARGRCPTHRISYPDGVPEP